MLVCLMQKKHHSKSYISAIVIVGRRVKVLIKKGICHMPFNVKKRSIIATGAAIIDASSHSKMLLIIQKISKATL